MKKMTNVCCCAVALACAGAVATVSGRQLPAAQAAESAAPKPSYVLQRGDEITVKVFNNPELFDTVLVRPDGMVSLMLLDDVQAAGLTVGALDAKLTEGYAKFFREPQVTVVVRTFAGLRVYVGGEVGQPGPVSLRGDVTALEAILQVGGFRPSARMDSVILLRNDGTAKPAARKLNFKELLSRKQVDIPLEPFDVLYVPVSRITKVDRFVDQYMRQLLPISLTGGFTYIFRDRIALVGP
jgi:protein involved in polysaccharide export with SLBB domain